jgi:tetratricopeptide (TPR) repeat protein
MPRAASTIAHTALTDHRIPRRPEADAGAAKAPSPWLPGSIPLRHFHQDLTGPDDPGVNRDLGLALTKAGKEYPQLGKRAALLAWPLLEQAVQRDQGDVAALEGKGYTLWLLGRHEDALATFETVLAKAPERESTLLYAAVLAALMGRTDAAIGFWQRALAVNPWPSQYRYQLAKLLAQRQEWPRVVAECETALELNPASEQLLTLLVTASLRTGNRERAETAFGTLLDLNPADEEALRRWFAGQLSEDGGR